jgi:hypothetical protein
MNAKFDVDGYEFEIAQGAPLTEVDPAACSGGHQTGRVGLQVIAHPLDRREASQSVMRVYVKPSQARAIASALLSAATEVRNTL